jgi:hypothetical protein
MPQASAVVPVTSAVSSKVNWTQIIAMAAMLLAYFTGGKLNLDPSQQASIVVVIGVVSQVVTIIFKTWFTNSVHPSSLPKSG